MTVTLKEVTLVTLPHFLPNSLNWHFYKHIESFFDFIQRFYFYFFGLSQKGKRNFALSGVWSNKSTKYPPDAITHYLPYSKFNHASCILVEPIRSYKSTKMSSGADLEDGQKIRQKLLMKNVRKYQVFTKPAVN